MGELEGKGHCANSEGITDTASVVIQLLKIIGGSEFAYFIARGKVQGVVEVGGKQVVVRVQRRVRMGIKDELGLPYILSSSQDHMTIYLYLFGSLHFLIRPF